MMLTVIVDDVNDNRPYFPPNKQKVTVDVMEEEKAAVIGQFNFAKDADESQSVCYFIIGEAEMNMK